MRAALKHPLVSMCTDSGASATDGIFSTERNHPRGWGSAARILGSYVREEKLLPLEEAIRKMTSLPASRMHLTIAARCGPASSPTSSPSTPTPSSTARRT